MLPQQAHEQILHHRVQALGWLVEDDELWFVLKRLDDRDLLSHPARIEADLFVEIGCGQLKPIAQVLEARRRPRMQRSEIVDALAPRHLGPQTEFTGDVTNPLQDRSKVARHVATEDAHRPLRGTQETKKASDGRGFAGAVGTEVSVGLALRDAQ